MLEERQLLLHHAVALGFLDPPRALEASKSSDDLGSILPQHVVSALGELVRGMRGKSSYAQSLLDLSLVDREHLAVLIRPNLIALAEKAGVDREALDSLCASLPPDQGLETALVEAGHLDPPTAMELLVEASSCAVTCPSCFGQQEQWSANCNSCGAQLSVLPADYCDAVEWFGVVLEDKYSIQGFLGRGGMASVYLGRHQRLDQLVAIKVLTRSHSPTFADRFLREAQIATRLNHPNIVPTRDFGDYRGHAFMVLDYCEGTSLRDIMDREERIPAAQAAEILSQVLSGLEEAHRADVVHRDLTPSNVMIEPGGRARILDFGLAKAFSPDELQSGRLERQPRRVQKSSQRPLTCVGTVMGTPHYMSPEQALGKPCDHRTDLFAAGVLLYEMLTGVPPKQGASHGEIVEQWLTEELTPLRDAAPSAEIPKHLEATVARALAVKAEDRWKSAEDFKRALVEPEANSAWRLASWVALVTLALVGLALLGLFLATRVHVPPPEELSKLAGRTFGALPTRPAGAQEEALAKLGARLFARPFTGGSCTECHDLTRYGTTGVAGPRDTLTVLNVGPQFAWFWDGRATSLEALSDEKLKRLAGGAGPLAQALTREDLAALTKAAFPDAEPDPGKALAAYLRTLLTPSAFDRFMKDPQALEPRQQRGLHLFVERGCTTCHIGPGVGGTMFQILGLKQAYPSADEGRMGVTGLSSDRNVFKVPALRNVSETAPYLHDGSVESLPEIVVLMGRHQLGIELPDSERDDIVAFLETLTGSLEDLERR